MSWDQASDQFKTELRSHFLRWEEESDLDSVAMCHLAVEFLNEYMEEPVVEFEPDQDFKDALNDDKHEEDGDDI
jgi:hypothetical protein